MRIIRDGRGAVVQTIPVRSWDFDAGKRVLNVASPEGDRLCPGAPTGRAWTGDYLRLDGQVYRMDKFVAPEGARKALTVYPARDGVFPLCTSSQAVSQRIVAKGPDGLDLEIDVISGGAIRRETVPVLGSIAYRVGAAPQVEASLADALLCFEAAGANGTELQGVDSNNRPLSLGGLSPIRYRPSERVFQLETTDALTCFVPPPVGETSFLSAGDVVACGEQGDQLFITSFEEPGDEPTPSVEPLKLELRVEQQPGADTGEPIIYSLIVQNCGTQELNNVMVRGFFPGPASVEPGVTATLGQMPSDTDCGVLESCVSANGYIRYTLPTLAAGEKSAVRVTRELTDGAVVGDLVQLTGVVAVDPAGSGVPIHAVKAWDVQVVDSSNVAPTLVVASGSLPTTTNRFVINEDAVAAPVTGFTLEASDPDSGFSCSTGNCIVATSNNNAVIDETGVKGTLTPAEGTSGTLALELSPRPNASGTATLSVSVRDAQGRMSDPVQIPIQVNPVNDPPSFQIGKGFDQRDKIISPTPTPYCTLTQSSANGAFVLSDAECPVHFWPSGLSGLEATVNYQDWIAGVSAGPGETGTVTLSLQVQDDAGIVSDTMFDPASGDLEYMLNGSRGTATLLVTASDGSASTTIGVEVRVQNAPPQFSSADSATVVENTTTVLTVQATDSDGGAVTYSIAGGTDSAAFTIGGSSGELSFATAPDFENPTDSNGDNVYQVVVRAADDSGATADQTITVTVTDANDPPVIVLDQSSFNLDGSSAAEDQIVVPASNFSESFDPEGATLTNWQIVSGNTRTDTGAVSPFKINNSTGEISINDPSNFESTSTTSFTLGVTVSDAISGGLDSLPAQIEIQIQ